MLFLHKNNDNQYRLMIIILYYNRIKVTSENVENKKKLEVIPMNLACKMLNSLELPLINFVHKFATMKK